MSKSKTLFVIGLTGLFLSSAFGGVYLKFEGVEGESKDEKHKGWIDIISVSGLVAPRDAASGMATGKRQHKPITVTKRIDKSSPLFQASGTEGNNPLFESRMTIDQDGTTYVLEGIKILSTEKKGDTETLTISYTSIQALPKAAEGAELKAKASEATDYNSSRSNRSTSN